MKPSKIELSDKENSRQTEEQVTENSAKTSAFAPRFSHIYIEKDVCACQETKEILAHFPNAQKIEIEQYKDIFNRRSQNPQWQHQAQSLILAKKRGALLYEGAPVCQSFGHPYFYYTSCSMNCLYDCEYCYLKGMYPGGHMVLFVNVEDIFCEIEQMLKEHPMYVCVSYDTDLLAMEGVTGFVKRWIEFTMQHKNLQIEIRTKCAHRHVWDNLPLCDRVVFAYTMSPDPVIQQYEHGTRLLRDRIQAVAQGIQKGYVLRLCFDPMLFVENWKEAYRKMIEEIFQTIPAHKLLDVSVGSFRISKEYLKKMRKSMPQSAVVQFPYELYEGVYQYPEMLRKKMENFLEDNLRIYIPRDKIFLWK